MSPTQTTKPFVHPLSLITVLLALCLVVVPLVACGSPADEADVGADDGTDDGAVVPAEPPADAVESVPPAGAAEGFEPVTSRGTGGAVIASEGPVADGPAIQAPGATFHLPAEWNQETPSSNMRLAQAAIPAPDGSDAGSAQLTVFYFGPGGGGGTDANLDRWVGQVAVDPSTQPKRVVTDLESGFRVHSVEVQGTLQPSTMGTGPTEPQPGSTLLGAVVEGPQGPWFFKATGPTETLDAQREAFFAMLRSMQPKT